MRIYIYSFWERAPTRKAHFIQRAPKETTSAEPEDISLTELTQSSYKYFRAFDGFVALNLTKGAWAAYKQNNSGNNRVRMILVTKTMRLLPFKMTVIAIAII